MRKLAGAIFLLMAIVSCENENESKYETQITPTDSSGLISSFTFEKDVQDHTGNLVLVAPSAPEYETSVNKTFALHLNSKDYIEFKTPDGDSLSFFVFFKSDKTIQDYGNLVRLIDIKEDASLELDGVSGPTYITVGESVAANALNTFNSWLFIYVELKKGSSSAHVVVKNRESSELKTYNYDLPLKEAYDAGKTIRIGTSFSLSNSFTGLVDNLKIFKRTLSSSELEYYYKNR